MWRRRSREGGESGRALQEANEALERIKSRDDEVKSVASASRKIRERNHFKEQLQELILMMPTHQGGGS